LLRFSLQEKHPTASLLLLFRKKSRSAYLFGCKRPHDGFAVAASFLRVTRVPSHRQNAEKIFLCGSYK